MNNIDGIKSLKENSPSKKYFIIFLILIIIILLGLYFYMNLNKEKYKTPEQIKQEELNNVAKSVVEKSLTPNEKEKIVTENKKNTTPIKISPKDAAAREEDIMKNLLN